MNFKTIERSAPIAGFVLACLAFAVLALSFSSCKTDDVLTPEEKTQVDALDTQAGEKHKAVKAAEEEGKAAVAAFAAAVQANDAEAQAAALQRMKDAESAWGEALNGLKATIAESSAIVDAAQRRAGAPIVEGSKLLGLPSPLVELVAGFGIPLAFDRSRKHLRDTLLNAIKGNFREAVLGPLRAVGLVHSSYDPRVLLEAAAKQARDKGDLELEAKIRATLGTLPTVSFPANTTVGAAVAGGAA